MVIEKSRFKKIFVLTIFIMLVSAFYSFNSENPEVRFTGLAVLSLISLVLFLFTKQCQLISITWFLVIFLYIYNCGQVWLKLFEYDFKYSSFLITQFSDEQISRALYFFIFVINVFEIFLIVFESRTEQFLIYSADDCFDSSLESDQQDGTLYLLLIVFSVVCFCVVTYNDVSSILLARTIGYLGSYTTGRSNAIVYMMINLFPFLIVLWLLIGRNQWKKIILFYAVIRSLLLMLLVGNRGQYIALLIILFLIYELEYRDSNKQRRGIRQYLGIVILGLVLLSIAGYVSNIRNIVNGSESFVEYLLKENVVISMLQELGGTFINTILTVDICPDRLTYAYGKTYIAAMIQLIPKGYSLISSYSKYINLGSVLNVFFSKGEGLGGSFTAELYYNFSWFSLCIVPFFSYALAKCDSFLHSRNISNLGKAVAYYYSYVALMYIRGEFCDFAVFTRYLLYFLIMFWLLRSRHK